MRTVRIFVVQEWSEVVDGVELIRSRIEMQSFTRDDPKPVINHNPARSVLPLSKRRFWLHFSPRFLTEAATYLFWEMTFRHIPTRLKRFMRWGPLPRRREPTLIEQFDSNRDYREHGDLSADDLIASIHNPV